MRDHRFDKTDAEREAGERAKQEITELMKLAGSRFEATPPRRRRRARADSPSPAVAEVRRRRRQMQRASRKANRR